MFTLYFPVQNVVFLPELDCSLAVFLSFFLFFGGWLQAAWMAGRPGDSAGVGGRVAGSMGEVGLLVTWVGYVGGWWVGTISGMGRVVGKFMLCKGVCICAE